MNEKNNEKSSDYNYIITILFIIALIIIRIFVNTYKFQNIVIAWVNFISMFYILWRIYFQVEKFLKTRTSKSILFKNQYKKFIQFALIIIIVLFFIMLFYSIGLFISESFYILGGCINDIISLCALLFSIEDEKIINTLINYYKYST